MAAHSTASDPHGLHDWHSRSYVDEWISSDATDDERRLRWLRRLVAMLPFDPSAAIRVLDVGAGYGLLTGEVARRFPQAVITAHDFSEPMLAHARQRLEPFVDRVTFVIADLRDPTWTHAVGGGFDAVVSAIAIHNVRDPSTIRRIFSDVRGLLRPGGCFYDIDFVAPGGPLAARAWGGRWRAEDDAEPGDLEHQLGWLRDAGFDEAECLLRVDGQTLLGAFVR